MNNKKVKSYVEELVLKNNLNEVYETENTDKIILSRIPNSMDEAKAYSNFWRKVVSYFKEDIEKIRFIYQENDKELPLSSRKKLLKSIGFNIKPEYEQGQIKSQEVSPKGFMGVREGLVSLFTDESEWKNLNSISKNTKDFSAPYVMALPDLCYRVNIPLEVITSVGFNSPDFLNKNYEKPEVKE
jgi:hypothetical protein